MLGLALVRLWRSVSEAVVMGLSPAQWAALVAIVLAMAWTEGYRAFQRDFSPRCVARAQHLARHPTALRVALAPLFCMAFFDATRRRLAVSYGVLGGVIALVVLIGLLPQPWRGIVDAGVVAGLGWGLAALLVFAARALVGRAPAIDPDLPRPLAAGR